MAAEGLSIDWYVHRHRTEDEVLPWAHISAGLHQDFLWQDWQDALAERGVEDCRWTPCYDCGVCTGYGIEHVVASPVPPAGGSQGTGQDLPPRRRRCPSLAAAGPSRSAVAGVDAGAAAVLQAGQGPLDQPPRRGPHVGAGPAPGRLPVAYTEGFSPRPKRQLRAGPVHRARVAGRVPRRRAGRGRRSTSASLPAAPRRRPARPGSTCLAGRRAGRRASRRCSRTSPPAAGRSSSPATEAAAVADGVAAALAAPTRSSSPASARARRSPTTSGPPSAPSTPARRRRSVRRRRAGHPAPGAAAGRAARRRASPALEARQGAAHPPMDRARRRAAGTASRSTRRRFRTHCGRAHEKGTSRCPTSVVPPMLRRPDGPTPPARRRPPVPERRSTAPSGGRLTDGGDRPRR